jgi:hypothetical protein
MATGKELARMMTCSNWKEFVKNDKTFCSAQIFDSKGKPISINKAIKDVMCHARILFKRHPDIKLMAEFLRSLASTSSEHMNSIICDEFYGGFQEIIIC